MTEASEQEKTATWPSFRQERFSCGGTTLLNDHSLLRHERESWEATTNPPGGDGAVTHPYHQYRHSVARTLPKQKRKHGVQVFAPAGEHFFQLYAPRRIPPSHLSETIPGERAQD